MPYRKNGIRIASETVTERIAALIHLIEEDLGYQLHRSVQRVKVSLSELETARRHGISVIVTVLNNQTLGYQRHAEDVLFGAHTTAVDFVPVDHAAIARACGLQGLRVTEPTDYADALALALKSPGTTVIDAFVDPDAHPPITLFENKTISRWSDSHESMA